MRMSVPAEDGKESADDRNDAIDPERTSADLEMQWRTRLDPFRDAHLNR